MCEPTAVYPWWISGETYGTELPLRLFFTNQPMEEEQDWVTHIAPEKQNVVVDMLIADVVIYMCKYLLFDDLVSMLSVCRKWRGILDDPTVDHVWREHVTNEFIFRQEEGVPNALQLHRSKIVIDYCKQDWAVMGMPASLRPCMSTSWWSRALIVHGFQLHPEWLIVYTLTCLDVQMRSMKLLVRASKRESVIRKTWRRLETHIDRLSELRDTILCDGCETLWWYNVWQRQFFPKTTTILESEHEQHFKTKYLRKLLNASATPERLIHKILHPGRHLLKQLHAHLIYISEITDKHTIFGYTVADCDKAQKKGSIADTFLEPLFKSHLVLLRHIVVFVRTQFLRNSWIARIRAPVIQKAQKRKRKRNDIRRPRRMKKLASMLDNLSLAAGHTNNKMETETTTAAESVEKDEHATKRNSKRQKTRHKSIYTLITESVHVPICDANNVPLAKRTCSSDKSHGLRKDGYK